MIKNLDQQRIREHKVIIWEYFFNLLERQKGGTQKCINFENFLNPNDSDLKLCYDQRLVKKISFNLFQNI